MNRSAPSTASEDRARSAMRCGIRAGKFAATARPKIRSNEPRCVSSRRSCLFYVSQNTPNPLMWINDAGPAACWDEAALQEEDCRVELSFAQFVLTAVIEEPT
jgi:hypothetical protein